MKTRIAAFALLLLAGAAPAALAQERDHDDRQGPMRPHGEEHDRGARPWRQAPTVAAPTPPAPREAQSPPSAPQAHVPQVERRGGGGPRDYVRRPGGWVDRDGDDNSQGVTGADRHDHEDRQELRDWRRYNGGRTPQVVDPRRFEPRGDDRRRDDHRGERRDDRRWDRDHDHDRDGDRDRRDRPQWRPGLYPHHFESARRYHARPYLRPPHFYAHVWSFGEFLPPAWFGPEYLIDDWWNYDLPAPPPGYDWVRVGDDALLVDSFSGRIVQVIRDLFW